ncbi:hypothetical protein VDG1235_2874 [Verrucomicrobiia bacterium DG1235]|nr:hypothetical protein VDG1235_2874 [Verrucomicrobiae bacterium DG1235]
MTLSKLVIAGLSAIALSCSAVSAAPVLIGNASLEGVSLSDSDMQAVLLGKNVSLGGKRVVIVVAKASDGQENFLKSKIGKTGSQFNNHWRKLFMTGGGVAPTQVGAEADVVSKVSSTPGAIGIVDDSVAGGLPVIGK